MNQFMSKLLIFIFILGVLKWKNNQEHAFYPKRDLASVENSACDGKSFCAVIYFAPWCPHCKDAVGETQKLVRKAASSTSLGIRVVVGAGQGDSNYAMASEFPTNGETDNQGKVAKLLSVRAFPSYFVLDKEGSVILSGQEAHEWMLQKFALIPI